MIRINRLLLVSLMIIGGSCKIGTYISGFPEVADPSDAPYIVSLQLAEHDYAFCSATLIQSTNGTTNTSCSGFIITTASCVLDLPIDFNQIIATMGNFNLTEDEPETKIRLTLGKVIQHTDYNEDTHENDIALVPVSFSIENTTTCEDVPILKILTGDEKINETATFFGWGLKVGNGPLQKKLHKQELHLQTDMACRDWYGYDEFKDSSMMCAGESDSVPCSYDTGGPLVCKFNATSTNTNDEKLENVLCGIAAKGRCNGKENLPGVFTEVLAFQEWIEAAMSSTP